MKREPLLTPREAAALLGISVNTLSDWRVTRRVVIPYFKMGGHVRYRESDLLAWIETCRVSG